MTKHPPKILIFKNLSDLHHYCADCFLKVVKNNPTAKIGFATGVSPLETYQLLVTDYQLNKTSWKQITTFNLDEFVGINPNHPEAFVQQMHINLFQYLDLNPKNIHIPNCQAINPKQEALDYENLIQTKGPIDFQYISLGINGHMAYNEPHTPFESIAHVANLTEETIADMVSKNKFANLADSPKQAITMGIQTILQQTKQVIMVAYGAHKALVTKAMIEDEPNSLVTASWLQYHPNCVFVLDEAAAEQLSPVTKKLAAYF